MTQTAIWLSDRADGVKGHFGIARRMKDNPAYVEFYNKGEWTGFGEVFIGESARIKLRELYRRPGRFDIALATRTGDETWTRK
jgi:hypothetical protein